MIRLAKGFVLFWYDFIVGDSIVLAIGAPLALGLAYGFIHAGDRGIVQFVLPVAVVATLAASLAWRADS